MTREQIRDWIYTSFKPVKLSLPPETIDQCIDATINFWNTHSAYKVARMFDYTGGMDVGQIQLSAEIKTVIHAYPMTMEEYLFSNHPMWVLLGFITLDRYTEDLMLLSNTFDAYRIYLGNDFRWKWIRSDDSTKGGWLHLQQVPSGSSKIAVIGLKRILANEDILDEFIYTWVRDYARAMVKTFEGNVLRKAQIIGIANDGESMVTEGKDEMEKLIESLRKEGRWLLMPVRK